MAATARGTTLPYSLGILVTVGQLLFALSITVTNGHEITISSPKYGDFAYWNRIRGEEEKALNKAQDEAQSPQIEVHLIKGHDAAADETWTSSNRHQYSVKDYAYKTDASSTNMEEEQKNCQCPCAQKATEKSSKEDRTQTNEQKIMPQLDSRNIIDDPGSSIRPKCPPGYRYEKGKCRFVEP